VVANNVNESPDRAGWGEAVVLIGALPGLIAATILGLALISERLGWQPTLGPVTIVLAYVAMSSPWLVVVGPVCLIGATLALRRTPGRSRYKWSILVLGILSWALAAYWLSVPGLIELP
jgi:hypothetical protein